MVGQRTKDLCFWLARPFLRIAGRMVQITWLLWRREYPLRLHLGCGDKYLPSFVNIDANPFRKIDLWLDLRNPLPFPDGAADGIYTQETLEHLYPNELGRLLRECRRVLKPGGFIRIGVPHLRHAVEAYTTGQDSWFPEGPRFYRSLGGRLSNFLLCDGQHRNAFDFSMLEELLTNSGFTQIHERAGGESGWIPSDPLSRLEADLSPTGLAHHLYVEARRP